MDRVVEIKMEMFSCAEEWQGFEVMNRNLSWKGRFQATFEP